MSWDYQVSWEKREAMTSDELCYAQSLRILDRVQQLFVRNANHYGYIISVKEWQRLLDDVTGYGVVGAGITSAELKVEAELVG